MRHRGLLSDGGADGPALRFARYAAAVVDGQGVITDLPGLLRGYSLHARVSIRTAYTDLGRVIARGLVRQLQAAAPGYPARYRLCAPAAAVAVHMPGLPPDLARAIQAPCAGLHTSPLMGEGYPPSRARKARNGRPAASRQRPGGIGGEERDQARNVLARCAADWRGRVPPGGKVEAMTAVALRYATPGDLAQLLTERTSGARDLPGLLCWRLGKVITSARRSYRQPLADERGERYRQMLASRRSGPGPSAKAEIERARAEIAAIRDAGRRALSSRLIRVWGLDHTQASSR